MIMMDLQIHVCNSSHVAFIQNGNLNLRPLDLQYQSAPPLSYALPKFVSQNILLWSVSMRLPVHIQNWGHVASGG